MLEQEIEQDLKKALLSGDRLRVSVLRGVKSALLYVKVAEGKRDSGLSEETILQVMAKESKKRQESADLYRQGGDETRAQAELSEKAIIDAYLPAQLTEAEIGSLIDKVMSETGAGPSAMGQIIGAVKQQSQGAADGAVIARLVKERLQG